MLLHTYEWGDPASPPIVCVHGVTAHGLRFRKLAEERLADRFYVLAVDLRGHGHSDWDSPWSLDAHVDDLAETAAARGIEQAVWIGHSFGGRLALDLAVRRPHLVGRLVLLDTALWLPPPMAIERAEAERVERAFGSRREALVARGVGLVHTPPELLEEELDQHLVRGDDGRFRYRYLQSAIVTAYGELTRPPDLDAVRAPTLLVRGSHSDVVPDIVVEVLLGGVPRLNVAMVDAGHNVTWDAFDETADAIERFLEVEAPPD